MILNYRMRILISSNNNLNKLHGQIDKDNNSFNILNKIILLN